MRLEVAISHTPSVAASPPSHQRARPQRLGLGWSEMQQTWEHSFGAVSEMADGRRARIRRWDVAGAPCVRHQRNTVFQSSSMARAKSGLRRFIGLDVKKHIGAHRRACPLCEACDRLRVQSTRRHRRAFRAEGRGHDVAHPSSIPSSSQGVLLLGTQKGSEAPVGMFASAASQQINVIQQTVDEAPKRQWRTSTEQTHKDRSWSRVFATAIPGRGAKAQGIELPGPANAATRGAAPR